MSVSLTVRSLYGDVRIERDGPVVASMDPKRDRELVAQEVARAVVMVAAALALPLDVLAARLLKERG